MTTSSPSGGLVFERSEFEFFYKMTCTTYEQCTVYCIVTSLRLHGPRQSLVLLVLIAVSIFQPKCDIFLPETSQGFIVKIDITRKFACRIRQWYYSLWFNNFECVKLEADITHVPDKIRKLEIFIQGVSKKKGICVSGSFWRLLEASNQKILESWPQLKFNFTYW